MVVLVPQDKLEQFKSLYGNIYSVEILGNFFVFRELRRGEFKEIELLDIDDGSKEDEICRRCTLSPDVFGEDLYHGGVLTSLSQCILRESGFLDPYVLVDKITGYRESYKDLEARYDALILAAFPNFVLSDLDKMPIDEYLRYLAASEFILVHFKGVHPDILKELHKPPQPQANFQMTQRDLIPPGTKMPKKAKETLESQGAQVGTVDPMTGLPRVYGSPAKHYGDAGQALREAKGYRRPA